MLAEPSAYFFVKSYQLLNVFD